MVDNDPSPYSDHREHDINESSEKTNPSKARQRWNLISLIKNSDTEADETAKKEKLKERVDEWMSDLSRKMTKSKTVEETTEIKKLNGFEHETESLESIMDRPKSRKKSSTKKDLPPVDFDSTSSTDQDVQIGKSRRKYDIVNLRNEETQQNRIRKREEDQKKRERELIINGKLKPDEDFYKNDKFFAIHKKLENIHEEQRKHSIKSKRKVSNTKIRWQTMVHKLHINPRWESHPDLDQQPSINNSAKEEVKCVEQEPLGTFMASNDETESDRCKDDSHQEKKYVRHTNPIYNAFENVEDVEDLYRLAEKLIDSAYNKKE